MDIDYLDQFLKESKIDIAILCVPQNSAQRIANVLIDGGVQGIWNFAPVDLVVPENIIIENVHLSESLLTISYLMNRR